MTSSDLQGPSSGGVLSEADAALALSRIHDVAGDLFRACLALDSLQQAVESDYGKSRAAAATDALDHAVSDLRAVAVMLSDGGAGPV